MECVGTVIAKQWHGKHSVAADVHAEVEELLDLVLFCAVCAEAEGCSKKIWSWRAWTQQQFRSQS